jgi:hypothetical protein
VVHDDVPTERSFLSRWSQRKLAAAREASAAPPAPASASPPQQAATSASAPAAPSVAAASPVVELPPVESLTLDSDFTAFLQPSVDPAVKRAALRKLFSDPHFNVMDGLDVYIDDYGKFEPMPPEIVKQLAHAKYLFDPPKTRVNAQGYVEDVPPEEAVAAVAAEPQAEIAADPVQVVAVSAPGDSELEERPRADDAGAADIAPDASTR